MGRHGRTRKRRVAQAAASSGCVPPARRRSPVRGARVAAVLAGAALLGGAGYGLKRWAGGARPAAVAPAPAAVPSAGAPQAAPSAGLSNLEMIAALKREVLAVAEELRASLPGRCEPLFFTGKAYQRHGNSAEAIAWWERGLAIDPRHLEAYVGMGWIAMMRGDPAQAAAHWERALALNPERPDLGSALARAYMALGRTADAIAALTRDIAVSPHPGGSLYLLGQQHLQLGDCAEAKRRFQEAVALEPELTNAYYGLMQAAQRLGEKELFEKYRAVFRELKARDMQELKDRNDEFKDVIDVRRDSAALLVDAGRIWASAGAARKAEAAWRRGAELDAGAVECRQLLAALCERSGRIAEAIARHEEVRAANPRNVLSLLALGQLYMRSGRPDGPASAEAALVQAAEAAPGSPYPLRDLALLYVRTNRNLGEARALAEKAVAIEGSAENYCALSRACYGGGDRAAALAMLARAVELAPENQDYRRALARLQAGE